MRKITQEAFNAFINQKNWSKSNTSVKVDNLEEVVLMYLFGNAIVKWDMIDEKLYINLRDWLTRTTLERLHPICGVYIRQGVPYINGNQIISNGWVALPYGLQELQKVRRKKNDNYIS